MDNGKLLGVLFVDSLRVFNTIGYFILSIKLPTYGVNKKDLNWFKHYLFDRQQHQNLSRCTTRVHILASIISTLLEGY